MMEDDNKKLRRVAIVGVEGSGKTVMLAGQWPEATASDALQALDWTLRRSAGPGRDPEDVGRWMK